MFKLLFLEERKDLVAQLVHLFGHVLDGIDLGRIELVLDKVLQGAFRELPQRDAQGFGVGLGFLLHGRTYGDGRKGGFGTCVLLHEVEDLAVENRRL